MDLVTIKNILTSLTIIFGVVFPTLTIGKIGAEALKAIGRNPEAASKIQTAMILAIAFAEAIAIYVLLVSLIIKFI